MNRLQFKKGRKIKIVKPTTVTFTQFLIINTWEDSQTDFFTHKGLWPFREGEGVRIVYENKNINQKKIFHEVGKLKFEA